jgi:hypothetical protein
MRLGRNAWGAWSKLREPNRQFIMNSTFNLPSQAEDIQRGYAAHTVAIRGSLSGGAKARPPKEDSFRLTATHVQEGDTIDVEGEFPSAPLFAFLDAVPLEIRIFRNQLTDCVQITLVAPDKARFGPVRLVWPDKEIVGEHPLCVRRRAVIRPIQTGNEEIKPMAEVTFFFPEEPLEVHLSGKELSAKDFNWTNSKLTVRIPKDAVSGQLLVVTRDNVYQSSSPIRIKNT